MPNIKITDTTLVELATLDAKLGNRVAAMRGGANAMSLLADATAETHEELRAVRAAALKGGAMWFEDEPTPGSPAVVDPEPDPVEPHDPIPPVDVDEGEPFEAGGDFDWLQDGYELSDAPKWMWAVVKAEGPEGVVRLDVTAPNLTRQGPEGLLAYAPYESMEMTPIPAEGSNHKVLCTSAGTPWNDHGPKWLYRLYNATGDLGNIYAWRVGNFHKGQEKEGHLAYISAMGDLHIHDIVAVQTGGQVIQLVWRTSSAGETGTWKHPELWPETQNPRPNILIERIAAIDCGVISEGILPKPMVPRASWPFSVFLPGHESITFRDLFVRTNHAKPFIHKTHGECRSHGVLIAEAEQDREDGRVVRAGSVIVEGLDAEVTDSDRSAMRFGQIGKVELRSGRMVEHGNARGIVVLSDVHEFTIDPEFDWSGTVYVFSHEKTATRDPWHNPIKVIEHKAGTLLSVFPSQMEAGQ